MHIEEVKQRLYNEPYLYRINLIVDDIGKSRNSLRSRELFYLLGFSYQTYRYNWYKLGRLFNLNEDSYNYIHVNEVKNIAPRKLLCITYQEFEDKSSVNPVYSIEQLYDYYASITEYKPNLAILVDISEFSLAETRRILRSQRKVSDVCSYIDLFNTFKKQFAEFDLPFNLDFTKNIYFQEIGIFHNEIEEDTSKINSFIDLFIDIYNKPFSPLWLFLSNLISNQNLYNKLLSGELQSEIGINSYFKLLDLIQKTQKNKLNEFMYEIKKELRKAIWHNYHISYKRKKLISDQKKKKIQAFLKELNNIKSPYNFILERLKDFCRINLN